jgi:hypothetical protein
MLQEKCDYFKKKLFGDWGTIVHSLSRFCESNVGYGKSEEINIE